jgi:hypothetical protein
MVLYALCCVSNILASPRSTWIWSWETNLCFLSGVLSHTPTARFPWGAIKGPPHISILVGHLFQLVNTLRHSLGLPTSLLQASFKSKLPRRDLSLTVEWPTRSLSQALHRWSLCARYSWGFVPLYGLACPRVFKVVVDPRKFVLPSPSWGFDSGN